MWAGHHEYDGIHELPIILSNRYQASDALSAWAGEFGSRSRIANKLPLLSCRNPAPEFAMSARSVTAARVRQMVKRQIPAHWGPSYLPAIKAVRGEAPGTSRVSQIPSARLQRDLHALSTAERVAMSLALHHGGVWEMWEQHMFMLEPTEHPLSGHPRARGLSLPTTSGTLAIAERLGLFTRHPQVLEETSDATVQDGKTSVWMPVPWIGDLLLFMSDMHGPYCVSWDVKKSTGAHGAPGPSADGRIASRCQEQKARVRDQVYLEYMRELAIKVVRVSEEELPVALVINLKRLALAHAQPIDLPPQTHGDLVEAFKEVIERGDAPSKVIAAFAQRGVPNSVSKRVLESAIYDRRIRVDLFESWSVDFPLPPERSDPLVQYASWFAR